MTTALIVRVVLLPPAVTPVRVVRTLPPSSVREDDNRVASRPSSSVATAVVNQIGVVDATLAALAAASASIVSIAFIVVPIWIALRPVARSPRLAAVVRTAPARGGELE